MVFRNRYVCLAALSIEILVEHMQAMSYLSDAPDSSVTWNSSALDLFKGLKDIALRFTGDTFIALYITASILVFSSLFLYLVLNERLHNWNRKANTLVCWCIWFFEHFVLGLCYIPILSQFVAVQYCAKDSSILSYSSLQCWQSGHTALLEVGYILSGFTLFLAGVIGPVFKSERKNGIERKFGNESYFLGMYKFLLMGVVFLFGPVHIPYLGILASAALISYMLVYEVYAEVHVASMYMGVLMAQMWVFICAHIQGSSTNGSDMLAAWIPLFVFGYAILPIKSFIIPRVPRVLPIEKQ